MIPEMVARHWPAGKLGAIYTPIFSGYGAEAIAARLRDSGAKLLDHRGWLLPARQDRADEGDRRRGGWPTRRPWSTRWSCGASAARRPGTRRAMSGGTRPCAAQSADCETLVTDAEDPYMLIYTSGTTGRPKGAVHVHCGFPIKGAQDMAHCFDVQPDDTLFWLTDMGWMMGPWAVSGTLMLGATLVLYEGAPGLSRPRPALGAGRAPRRDGAGHLADGRARADARMATSRCAATTCRRCASSARPASRGTPARGAGSSMYVGGGRCPIINYSGGTEISGGIVGCITITPHQALLLRGPCPAWPPTSSTSTATRCAGRSASW